MKLIVLLLGMAVLSFVVYRAVLRPHPTATPVVKSNGDVEIQQGQVNPQQQMQNVHKAADRIEQQQQERADEALRQNGN